MTTTWNPSDIEGGSLSGANTRFTKTSDADGGVRSIASIVTGKRYFEILIPTFAAGEVLGVGVAEIGIDLSVAPVSGVNHWAYFSDGTLQGDTGGSGGHLTFTAGDRIRIAVDSGNIWFGHEATWLAGDPSAGTGASYTTVTTTVYPVLFCKKSGTVIDGLFGSFYYTPPTAFIGVGDTPANPPDEDSTPPNTPIIYPNPDINPPVQSIPTPEVYAIGDSVSFVVTLNSIDVTADTTGQIRVKNRRNESGSADFSLTLGTGAVDVNDWIGKSVSIDYNHSGLERIFTGRVETPSLIPDQKTVSFQCTDAREDITNALSIGTIDAAVGGYHSDMVFTKEVQNSQYLKDRVSTRNVGYELDREGNGVLSWLDADGTPHYSFDNDTIDQGSLKTKISDRSGIINKYVVNFDFRYTLQRHRERPFYWNISRSLEEYITVESFELPTKKMIEDAVRGTGVMFKEELFETLPTSGVYFSVAFVNLSPNFVMTAYWDQAERWIQTVTEKYQVTINSPQSQTAVGVVEREANYSHAAEYGDTEWETFDDYQPPPAGFTESPNGDYINPITARYIDGRPAFDNGIKTAIAQGMTTIRASHRDNQVEFTTDLQPEIGCYHTVSIDYDDGNVSEVSRGKVLQYEHVIDHEKGIYDTVIIFDVSKTDPNSPPAEPGVNVPALADVSDAPETLQVYQMDTHLGGHAGAPVFDPDWEGFTGNFEVIIPPNETYEREFNAITQPVDSDFKSEREAVTPSTIDIPVADEPLTITGS